MAEIRDISPEAEKLSGILVVDDDVQVLKFVTRMLASLGYGNVFQAATTDEAREIWSRHSSHIFLVITDFVMPHQTGDVMAMEMVQQNANLKILLISGNDPFCLTSTIPLKPGVNFLQKPFTIGEMRNSIETLRTAP